MTQIPIARPAEVVAVGAPEVLLIVVTYNSATLVRAFLEALPAALEGAGSARVALVDNGSGDGTVELVRELASWVDIVDAGANLGYAAAINIGMHRMSPVTGFLIVNPDTVLAPGSVRTLRDAATDGVGATLPRVLDVEGKLKYSMRREPTLLRALMEATLGGHRASQIGPGTLGEYVRDDREYVDGASPDWATGAAQFITRAAADAVGRWDERFFLYSEETDYAMRLRDAGFRLRYVPAAVVIHPGGDMSKSTWLWSLVAVNRTRLYAKRHGPAASLAFWLAVVANEAFRSLRRQPTHRAALTALLSVGPRRALSQASSVSTLELLRPGRPAR
jgi:N-acetylglucosaminyl-diphospho-decaprenol L-rhamnosyltransferase